jgi:hypothetical protein
MSTHAEAYAAAPSALRYMLQACLPSPGWDAKRGFPDLRITWAGYRIEAETIRSLAHATDTEVGPLVDKLLVLLPHVTGFRLLMAMLTHSAWPLPIWRALQVRNRLLLHRPFQAGERFDLITHVAGWRVLEKGIEVDLHTRLHQGIECAWESVVTFYYRGRYGASVEHGAALGAAPTTPTVGNQDTTTAHDCIEGTDRWCFGALTGDYNGIHQWDWYARQFGFPAAFAHPQRVAARCLANLPPSAPIPQQLDLWIKGPVFYGRELVQRQSTPAANERQDFGLWIAGDARPALVGSWYKTAAA